MTQVLSMHRLKGIEKIKMYQIPNGQRPRKILQWNRSERRRKKVLEQTAKKIWKKVIGRTDERCDKQL